MQIAPRFHNNKSHAFGGENQSCTAVGNEMSVINCVSGEKASHKDKHVAASISYLPTFLLYLCLAFFEECVLSFDDFMLNGDFVLQVLVLFIPFILFDF